VLDAIDMSLRQRDYHWTEGVDKLVHHSDAGSQYTSFRFTRHLLDSSIDASIGTVGDALDNALAESAIGMYKTELIKPRGHWHTSWSPDPNNEWTTPGSLEASGSGKDQGHGNGSEVPGGVEGTRGGDGG
jgi:transposase InsO family protein